MTATLDLDATKEFEWRNECVLHTLPKPIVSDSAKVHSHSVCTQSTYSDNIWIQITILMIILMLIVLWKNKLKDKDVYGIVLKRCK